MKKLFLLTITCLFILNAPGQVADAADTPNAYAGRMELYKNMEATLQIPWYYLAGADQYEHSLRAARRDLEPAKGLIGIHIEPSKWSGALNPDLNDVNPLTITFLMGWARMAMVMAKLISLMIQIDCMLFRSISNHMVQMKIISGSACGIIINEIKPSASLSAMPRFIKNMAGWIYMKRPSRFQYELIIRT